MTLITIIRSAICCTFLLTLFVVSAKGQSSVNLAGAQVGNSEFTLTYAIGEVTNQLHQGDIYSVKNGIIQFFNIQKNEVDFTNRISIKLVRW